MPFTVKDWQDGPSTNTPISSAALEDLETRLSGYTDSRVPPVFYVTNYGARGDGSTDDTAAIQAAIDAAAAAYGICYLPTPSSYYMFSNLKVNIAMKLEGSNMGYGAMLKRIPGSTGAAIREKTAGEGGSGATGLWIRNIGIDGNSTTGNGLDIGNQGGAQLNFLSCIENVFVRNFTTGIGINLNQNAALCRYLWSNSNNVGIQVSGGGSSTYVGVWAENNAAQDMILGGSQDQYFGVHTEPVAGSTESIKITGQDCSLFGVTTSYAASKANVILIASGAARNSIFNYSVSGGGTFTNAIFMQTGSIGTGASQTHIPMFLDDANGTPSWLVNQTTGERVILGGSSLPQQMSKGTAAPTTGTHAVGEIVWNTSPAAGGTIGWICTTAGTPGTWKTWGAISA